MRIEKVIIAEGLGGYFWQDEAAEKAGAKRNGFVYDGEPVTPDFTAIRIPSQAICLSLLCEDGQIASGDCVAVQYSGRSGRDPVFWKEKYLPFCEKEVVPHLQCLTVDRFRPAAEWFVSLEFGGMRLHSAIQYGVTQALLEVVALSKKVTMAEVIAEEYGTEISKEPIDIFCQVDEQWHENTEKCILRRVPIFPHLPISSPSAFEKLEEFIPWVRERIVKLAGTEFKPILQFDLYATLGMKFNNSIKKMIAWLDWAEKALAPYQLIIEEPVDMGSRENQINFMSELKAEKDSRGLNVILCADEWCNTLDDIKAFVEADAADMMQLKTPDMGGVHNIIEGILFLKEHKIRAYLGGSSTETFVSRRVMAHVGLATQADQLLAAPGMGIDEGYTFAYNEMAQTLSLLKQRER